MRWLMQAQTACRIDFLLTEGTLTLCQRTNGLFGLPQGIYGDFRGLAVVVCNLRQNIQILKQRFTISVGDR